MNPSAPSLDIRQLRGRTAMTLMRDLIVNASELQAFGEVEICSCGTNCTVNTGVRREPAKIAAADISRLQSMLAAGE
jgi:hypothetical protein